MDINLKLTFDGDARAQIKSVLMDLVQELDLVPVHVSLPEDMPADALTPDQRAAVEAVNAPVTDEEVKKAASDYMHRHSTAELRALLNSFGINKASECPQDRRRALLVSMEG